jgi:hypothetical protein
VNDRGRLRTWLLLQLVAIGAGIWAGVWIFNAVTG